VKALPIYATEYTKEEIEAEERKPKRKVALMIGYSGTGYKGMQLNDTEKTIEGDLFQALVAAGAISKANATDPKKSHFVRCARTDKGVHAAGNIVSLKMIIEEEDIVEKINAALSPQIRVWGYARCPGSFSAYQQCDSRIYEYLIPTHCFLPPHPESFLGKKMVELAEEAGDTKGYQERQEEVANFWPELERDVIKPMLEELDPETRATVFEVLLEGDKGAEKEVASTVDSTQNPPSEATATEDDAISNSDALVDGESTDDAPKVAEINILETQLPSGQNKGKPVAEALKSVKAAIISAKRSYRIPAKRLDRVRSCLSRYVGTINYHNYTVGKRFNDPSAKRIIKSFVVSPEPIIVNGSEWLSLKVHGQSFMLHQIRKMVLMIALVIRCGCHEGRMQDSFSPEKYIIPKAPSLGLLLERPVFDSYNSHVEGEEGRGEVGFTAYEAEMEEFKRREIYDRIHREEERDGQFHAILSSLDAQKRPELLYLSSMGIKAVRDAEEKLKAAGTKPLEDNIEGGAESEDEGQAEDL
jgi:tRNA pseudouridine38-40 synthase